MKIYLASRYSRRDELSAYAAVLKDLGQTVTSRWLDGHHEIIKEMRDEYAYLERQRFAQEDWEDLMAADVCINFTEPPRSEHSRGGRHVEFGGALAAKKRCIVIGFRENVFHCLPQVEFYTSFNDFLGEVLVRAMEHCP